MIPDPTAILGTAPLRVGVQAVAPHHLNSLVRKVLREHGQEVDESEDFEVAVAPVKSI